MASPARLTAPQLQFLRKHVDLDAVQLADYLHAGADNVTRWETGEEERVSYATDRLLRLVAPAIDPDFRPEVAAVAQHLPKILDQPGDGWELHIDVITFQCGFNRVSRAA